MEIAQAAGLRTVASGAQPLQILNEQGELVGDDPRLPDTLAVRIFELMVRNRAYDTKGVKLRHQGRVGEWYAWSGQEAQVASALALGPEDWVFAGFRESGVYMAHGLPLAAHLEFVAGYPRRLWDPHRHRLTPFPTTMGTSLPHAPGFAREMARLGRAVVALANCGDGASSMPDFHAALNFAGVWRAPVVFYCANNQWAASVPVHMQTAGAIADRAVGYGIHGLQVDGMDPLAVYVATREAVERARRGEGATLIEGLSYRFGGHAAYEAEPTYRPAGEQESWEARDPIDRMRAYLRTRGLHDEERERGLADAVVAEMEAVLEQLERTAPSRDVIVRNTYSGVPARMAAQLHEIERAAGEPETEFGEDELWTPDPEPDLSGLPAQPMNMAEALNAALHAEMERDESILLLGEDMVADGGVFTVTKGLPERFGLERVVDTPLCETGIVGASVGMAIAGARPVPEIQFSGFVYTTFDQIVGHVARMRWRTSGRLPVPVVVRVAGHGFEGLEFHVDAPEGLFAHAPGLIVVVPSGPVEAKGLLTAALRADDPVLFLEPIALYFAAREDVPTDPYEIPLGRACIARAGSDVTVVTYGRQVGVCLEAAQLAEADGRSLEVVDLRTLKPWDEALVLDSVRRTGRLVVAHEGWHTCGIGAEICATVAEEALYELEAPPQRVAMVDAPPPGQRLERMGAITAQRVLAAVERALTS